LFASLESPEQYFSDSAVVTIADDRNAKYNIFFVYLLSSVKDAYKNRQSCRKEYFGALYDCFKPQKQFFQLFGAVITFTLQI
jgi:hypothetical protein